MYGIFVNENGGVRYAEAIVGGYKTVETRSRNMLRRLVGERVAVVRTRRNASPLVVGYVDIIRNEWCPRSLFDMHRDETLIPEGSSYDIKNSGKWFYRLDNPERCDPYPLPTDTVRHGRSWCEF